MDENFAYGLKRWIMVIVVSDSHDDGVGPLTEPMMAYGPSSDDVFYSESDVAAAVRYASQIASATDAEECPLCDVTQHHGLVTCRFHRASGDAWVTVGASEFDAVLREAFGAVLNDDKGDI